MWYVWYHHPGTSFAPFCRTAYTVFSYMSFFEVFLFNFFIYVQNGLFVFSVHMLST